MRGEDRRPLPALLHGSLLAHSLPQVLLLPGPAGGHWHHLLQQRGHDSVSERLHQTVRAQRGVQRLRPVDPSQRNGDEGAGKCLPPQVLQLCHLSEQTDARRSLPLHQRHNLLRARQTRRCLAQQPPAPTPEQLRADRPEGMLSRWPCPPPRLTASLLFGEPFFSCYCHRRRGSLITPPCPAISKTRYAAYKVTFMLCSMLKWSVRHAKRLVWTALAKGSARTKRKLEGNNGDESQRQLEEGTKDA